MIFNIFMSLIMGVPILLGVAFITLLERKFLSLVGLRLGPNKVLISGLGQPIMDALKLMQKQVNYLMNFSFFFYYLSSAVMLVCSISIWSSMFLDSCNNMKSGMAFIMLVLGINSVSSIMAGWSVFSKFSLIGSIRTVSLLISYESVLYFVLMSIIYFYSTMDLSEMFMKNLMFYFIFPMSLLIWIPSMLADLNRTPYDFSEGESELVSGFNTEFGSSSFTMIFLAEYSNIIFFSFFTSMMFFSSMSVMFPSLVFIFIIWVRAVLPRYRFDKLMALAWKFLIPIITLMFLTCSTNWL